MTALSALMTVLAQLAGLVRSHEVARVATVATIASSTLELLATVAIAEKPVAPAKISVGQGSSHPGHRGHRQRTYIRNPSVLIGIQNGRRVARSILSFEMARVARVATRLCRQGLNRGHPIFGGGQGGHCLPHTVLHSDRRSRAPPGG
jgi:hypothetical protein